MKPSNVADMRCVVMSQTQHHLQKKKTRQQVAMIFRIIRTVRVSQPDRVMYLALDQMIVNIPEHSLLHHRLKIPVHLRRRVGVA